MVHHIHLPKPLHGWKSFFGEVSVIVIGVLIALTAEEAITEYNWHRKAEQGEAALTGEAEWMSFVLAEQVTVAPCIEEQIVRLRRHLLDQGNAVSPVEAFDSIIGPEVIRAPSRPLPDGIWRSLQNDGTASHMERERELSTGGYYSQLDSLRILMSAGADLRDQLIVLSEPVALSEEARFEALRTLSELNSKSQLQALVAIQMLAQLRDLDRLAPAKTFEEDLKPNPGGPATTIAHCTERHMPLGDWKKQLAAIEPEDT